jgi:hypothetical protein
MNNCVRGIGPGRKFVRNRGIGRVDRYLDEARIRDLDLYDVPLKRHRIRLTGNSGRMHLQHRLSHFHHM